MDKNTRIGEVIYGREVRDIAVLFCIYIYICVCVCVCMYVGVGACLC